MGIEAKVTDPTGLIARIRVAVPWDATEVIVIEYNGDEPAYRLETRPMRATLTIREGKTRRKAIVEFSGILGFPPREIADRCMIVRPGWAPGPGVRR